MRTFDSVALLREYGMRPTLARIVVLDLFKESQSLTPEQAYRQLLRQQHLVSQASVYRALRQLVEVGLLSRQQLDGGPGHYFLGGPNNTEHMLCKECGVLLPVPGPELASVLKRLVAKHGYLLGEYSVAMQGTCNGCSRKKPESAALRRRVRRSPAVAARTTSR